MEQTGESNSSPSLLNSPETVGAVGVDLWQVMDQKGSQRILEARGEFAPQLARWKWSIRLSITGMILSMAVAGLLLNTSIAPLWAAGVAALLGVGWTVMVAVSIERHGYLQYNMPYGYLLS